MWQRLRPSVVLALGIAAAAVQIGAASRWAGKEEHFYAVALGWVASLAIACARRDRELIRPRAGDLLLGATVYAAVMGVAIVGRHAYSTVDRFIPAMTGAALAVMATGLRRLPRHRSELAILSVPLIDPLPYGLAKAVMPLQETTALASAYVRLLGIPVERQGRFLVMPGATLEVYEACSGLAGIAQLLVLVVLVLAVFPSTLRQKLLVASSAILVGFAVNSARVAFLAVVASRAPSQYAYFERYGTGSLVFPVIATALAGLLWWLVLRSTSRTAS